MAASNVNICKFKIKTSKETFMCEIDNFSDRRQVTGENFDSGHFTLTSPSGNTVKWLLRIYPNGDSQTNKDYVSIYVFNLSNQLSAKIECSIRDAKGVDKQQTVVENRDFFRIQRAYLTTFIKRDELFNAANGLLPGGRLTIVCKITVFEETMTMESGKIDDDIKVPECNGMEDIGILLENGSIFTDCKLVAIDGKEFKVHKCILACRSRVFAAMFGHQMSESKEGVVKIKDIKSEVLEQMLRFIYNGTAPKLCEMAKELLEAADKYELDRLKAICERELANSMNTENVCELLALAHLHSTKQLKAHAIKFIQHNAKELVNSNGWRILKATYGELELISQIVEAMAEGK